MAHDTAAFRQRYRAQISRWYNPWLHGGFMLAYGSIAIGFFAQQLSDVSAMEWLALPCALALFSWGEYSVHLHCGHIKRPWSKLFYQRHTGDHHSFFVEGQMVYETPQDWRVILFPPWLIVLYSLGAGGAWLALSTWNANVGALFALTLMGGYMAYEVCHVCEHLPEGHWIARLPGIQHLHRLHALHHRRDLMQTHNFNIVLPLVDWLKGTLHWERPER
jgi:hypothetical protein